MLYVALPPVFPVAALIILPLVLPVYWQKVLISTAIFALLAMSWDFLVSVGMVSLGQALFFGAGAYAAGLLNRYLGFPIWLTIPLATVIGGAFSTLVLLPVLRLRGVYFSMVTLVLPLMLERIVEATGIFGGTEGLTGISPFGNQWVEIYSLLAVLLVALFGFRRLVTTDYGLVLKADIAPRLRAGVHLARAQIYQEWKQPARVAQEQAEAAAALRGQPGVPQSLGENTGLRPPPAGVQAVAVPPEIQRALQLFQQSVANAQRGKLDEAIKQLDEVIKLAPRFAEARVNRGVLLVNRGRVEPAIADLTRAIELGLKTPAIYAQRGLALALKGDCSAAVADFDVALKTEPNQMQWLGWRANCLRRISRFDDARRDLDRVIAADSKLAPAYDERARVFALKGELLLALADASQQIGLTPKNPLAYLLRGAIHHQLGNLQSALADLKQAIALDPKLALAYQERRVIYMKLNQPDLAAQDQKKLAELSHPPAK